MRELVLDFHALSNQEEKYFLKVFLELQPQLTESERMELQKFVKFGQKFVQKANQFRIHVSIRDIMRTLQLYNYFKDSAGGALLVPLKEKSVFVGESTHWPALIVAVALSYYFRLTPTNRAKFEKIMDIKLKKCGCYMAFSQAVRDVLEFLYQGTNIPVGIARTQALMENLLCTVVSIDNTIPLIITGPPGCSKTLSFSIAVENMKGKQSSQALYRSFHHIHPFHYQCSEQSTDTEIEAIYNSAIERQRTFEGNGEARCVVFLDEAGLPQEDKMPLKVLHYHLDHPVVSSVILSNVTLDAAKTNRALQLLQSAPSPNDLHVLAKGCLFGSNDQIGLENKNKVHVKLLSCSPVLGHHRRPLPSL
jgi:hypothetical protein